MTERGKVSRIEGFIAGVLLMLGISHLFIAYTRAKTLGEFILELGIAVVLGGIAITWIAR